MGDGPVTKQQAPGEEVACVADRRALVRFNSETVPRALDFLPFYRRMLEASARRLAGE